MRTIPALKTQAIGEYKMNLIQNHSILKTQASSLKKQAIGIEKMIQNP